jgi:hypothetical protein
LVAFFGRENYPSTISATSYRVFVLFGEIGFGFILIVKFKLGRGVNTDNFEKSAATYIYAYNQQAKLSSDKMHPKRFFLN